MSGQEDQPYSPATSITRNIYCHNSGVILGRLEVCIFEGHLAYLEAHNESVYLHPFYRLSSALIVKKLEDALHSAQESGWALGWREKQRLQLLVSAILFHMNAIKQDRATLPSLPVAVGSAGRLLGLAKWYFYVNSERVQFPVYSVSKKNENLEWENFKFWLDAAMKTRESWSKRSKELAREAQIRAHEQAIKEIRDDVIYKRLDLKKIWAWIELQLLDNMPDGRIQTLKNLFLTGDIEVHEWSTDDVDDLREAVLKFCDMGNEITHFIGRRLDGIAALIRDFYSGFTILNWSGKKFSEEQQTPQEALFLSEYDKKAEVLEALPDKPKRENFSTLGLFLRAEAQWNILSKRYKLRQEQQAKQAAGPSVDDL